MSEQILGLTGSALVLVAYWLTVEMPERPRLYFSLSLAGGIVLLALALLYRNFGLIFLEAAWIAINLRGLYRARRERMHAGG